MKRFVFGLATCAIALASCSTNDVLEQGSGSNNPNVINFNATTTRASVNKLDQVKDGFPVYAVTTKNEQDEDALAWAIENKTYKFEGNTWKWDITQSWPISLKMFPMNFYAYYPAAKDENSDAEYAPEPTKNGEVVNVNTLKATITIGSTASDQEDYLAANSTGITRPMATVPLAFKHITTKINFGVIAAAGTKSYVQQMNINNVKNTGTYNYVTTTDTEKWGNTASFNTQVSNKYDYYGTPANNSDNTSIIPVVAFMGNDEAVNFYPCTPEPVLEVVQDRIDAADKNLMLLPQAATPVWTPSKFSGLSSEEQNEIMTIKPAGKIITPLKAYIGSVYRMIDEKGNDLVGFADASNHPNYDATKHSDLNGKPLFVKVGFPLTAKQGDKYLDLAWTMGKAYTYNIALGQLESSGGYILDDRYYDEKGNPTDLTIEGKDPGDPVLGGTINFHVTVGDWEDGQGGTNPDGSGSQIN